MLDMNRNKIIMLMLHLGMSVADLSRVSGVSECSIRNILTRGQRPRFSTVVKLASALQVDAIEIIKQEGLELASVTVRKIEKDEDKKVTT